MRMIDIAVLFIIIQMMMGFLTLPQLGLFTKVGIGYMGIDAASNSYAKQYQSNDTINKMTGQTTNSVNPVTFAIDWALAGFMTVISIIGAFTFIGWALYVSFHMPIEICVIAQGIWGLVILIGILQWKSGRGLMYYE